jgi:hypothetical protein
VFGAAGRVVCSGVRLALFPPHAQGGSPNKRRFSRPTPFNRVTPASQPDLVFCKRLKIRTCGSRTCKPNSVRRIAPGGTAIPLGPASLRGSSDLPGGLTRRAGACAEPRFRAPSLFGLAPCGVCPARCITAAAVRSYRTFSPLLRRCRRGGIFSVALSVNRA